MIRGNVEILSSSTIYYFFNYKVTIFTLIFYAQGLWNKENNFVSYKLLLSLKKIYCSHKKLKTASEK